MSNHVSTRFQRQLEAEGVSVSDWVALRTLWTQDEASHGTLIDALRMTKGAVSKLVSRLEDKGLAQRQAAGSSARDQALVLTDAGRALVPRLAALADANDAHFFGHLSPPEREALLATLQGLVAHHQLKDLPTG